MPVEKIVLNASPLILLCNGELSFVLPELFSRIVVPEAVWREITNGPHLDLAAKMLPEMDWLEKVHIHPIPDVVRWDLGMGETEVLSFAVKHSDYTPVLDDMLAKKCARSLGIPTMGTGTILILAKERGLIESVEQSLRRLQVDKEHFQALPASIATARTYHTQALGDEPRAMKYARQALNVNKCTLAITKAKDLNLI